MGYMQLGVLPQRRGHTCDLPGQDGLPDVAADGSAVWRAEGQVIRGDAEPERELEEIDMRLVHARWKCCNA